MQPAKIARAKQRERLSVVARTVVDFSDPTGSTTNPFLEVGQGFHLVKSILELERAK